MLCGPRLSSPKTAPYQQFCITHQIKGRVAVLPYGPVLEQETLGPQDHLPSAINPHNSLRRMESLKQKTGVLLGIEPKRAPRAVAKLHPKICERTTFGLPSREHSASSFSRLSLASQTFWRSLLSGELFLGKIRERALLGTRHIPESTSKIGRVLIVTIEKLRLTALYTLNLARTGLKGLSKRIAARAAISIDWNL